MEVQGCCGKVSAHHFPLRGLFFEQLRTSWLTSFRLEERRKVKGAAFYERKKAARRQLAVAQKDAKVDKEVKDQLAEYGY